MENKHAKLMAFLQTMGRPVTFSEIAPHFDVPERTLRSWLKKLADASQIAITGEKKGRKYCIYQETASFMPAPEIVHPSYSSPHFFSEYSLALLARVRAPLFERDPCTYHEAWLDAYVPNQTFYLSEKHRTKMQAAGARFSKEMPAGTYAKRIFNRLLIDLSYNSSRLEGNTYSLIDTEKLLSSGEAAKDKLDIEKVMILNHKEAIKFLVERRIEVNIENIRSLHYLLADGLVLPDDAGEIRDEGVRIASTTYMPFDKKEKLESILNKIVTKASKIIVPYEQSFFLLVHIAYLQPFVDVNKRTSRLVANIPLVQHNLVPLSFNDINKDDYISAVIATYELNEVLPLAELYAWSYLRTCKQYIAVTESMGIDTLRIIYRDERRGLISKMIKKDLHGENAKAAIQAYAIQKIPAIDQEKFIADVQNDLLRLAPHTIAGMTISLQDLKRWKEKEK